MAFDLSKKGGASKTELEQRGHAIHWIKDRPMHLTVAVKHFCSQLSMPLPEAKKQQQKVIVSMLRSFLDLCLNHL